MGPPKRRQSFDAYYAKERVHKHLRDEPPSRSKTMPSSPMTSSSSRKRDPSPHKRSSSREQRLSSKSQSMRQERTIEKSRSSRNHKQRSRSAERVPSSPHKSSRNRSSSRERRPSSSRHSRKSSSRHLRNGKSSNRRSTSSKKEVPRKIGTFRPYFVPVKKHMFRRNSNDDSNLLEGDHDKLFSPDPPASTLHKAMASISVASFIHEGIPVLKVSHNNPPKKWQRRILTLSKDQMSLFLTHSKVKPGTTRAQLLSPNSKHTPNWRPSKGWGGNYLRAIDIADIHFWQMGVVASRVLEQSVPHQTKLHHFSTELDAEQVPKQKSKKNLSQAAIAATSLDPKIEGSIVTIFYHSCHGYGTVETLDLAIENPDHRRALVATLALLKKTYQETSQMTGNETLALRYVWKDMELSLGCDMVTEREFATICHRLQIEPPDSREYKDFCKMVREELKTESFVKTPAKYKQALSPENCMRFLQLLKMKGHGSSPAMDAWKICFGKANTVNDQTLLNKFLHGPQQEQSTCDLQDARDVIGGMNAVELCGEKTRPLLARSTLTKVQFEEFLRSELNDIYDPLMKIAPDNEQEPLDRPISHYWINSSNNTFLMMSQDKVMGINDGTDRPCIIASVEAYAKALENGARSIELCCLDGPKPLSTADPYIPMVGAIDHGSKITFQSVIMVVRRFLKANEGSYPICINIENHCTKPFQVQMAKLLKSVFGNTLFVPTSIHRSKQLPSPDELIGLVVVNLKKPPSDDDEDTGGSKNPSSEIWNVQTNGGDVYAEMFNKFNSPAKPESKDVGTFLPETGVLSTAMSKRGKMGKGGGADTGGLQYANELLSLTLFHDANFTGYFEDSLDLVCSHMHTIDESQVPKIAIKYENNPELWRKYGEDHLTRIVPRAKNNFSSKNFNPVLAWSMGCQMANINFHSTMDRNMALNDGMFRQMGGIGYILKPPYLMGEADKSQMKRIKIRILSGSCLQRPSHTQNDDKGDEEVVRKPYVVMELHDVQVSTVRDQEKFEISTHKVKCANDGTSNGFAPLFHDKGKDFVVETPDVAMLMFQVMDTDLGLLGMAAIPVNCLRRGYRSVQLYDKDCTREGAHAFATLLVYLQLQ